jgi:hypothetical protein
VENRSAESPHPTMRGHSDIGETVPRESGNVYIFKCLSKCEESPSFFRPTIQHVIAFSERQTPKTPYNIYSRGYFLTPSTSLRDETNAGNGGPQLICLR